MVNLRKIAIHLNELNCGGAERLMLDQAREFAQRGYLVDLLVYRNRGDFYPKAIEIINAEENISLISFDSYAFLMSLSKLFKYLRNNEGVILVSSISTIFKSLIAKKILGSKIILVVRIDIDSREDNINIFSFLKYRKIKSVIAAFFSSVLMPSADAIVCVSKGVTENFKSITPKAKDLVHTIYCSVPSLKVIDNAEKKVEVSFLESNKSHPIIVSVGRLERQKNYSMLLKAFHEVLKERPAQLVLVGDGSERNNLEKEARILKLSDHIFFAGYQENPYPFIKKSDIFVLSSNLEGCPLVLIETLSLGVSIVSTDCPSGPREILQNGKYGKLVPVKNPKLMAKSILETLDARFEPEDLKKRAKFFSPDIATDAYLDLFKGVMATSKLQPKGG